MSKSNRNKSVMTHNFSEVPRADIPRSSFDRSHGHKTTFDADYLVPILVDDVIPGDTFRVNANFFARLSSPTIQALMDNMYLETFFFFVPYRLVWSNWEKFCGAQTDPGDSIDYTIPIMDSGYAVNSADALFDHMGLPWVSRVDPDDFSTLPFRAYNLIYNEWFRDQNLQDSLVVSTGDGPDSTGDYTMKKRGKRHDYFTSALPWPQKGTAVDLPLGTIAPVLGIGTDDAQVPTSGTTNVREYGTGATTFSNWMNAHTLDQVKIEMDGTGTDANPLVYADLASATAATINDIRLAFQTQKLLERDARSGTRYVETIKAHFGVTVPDFRLQRPEFLGGGSSPVNITPIAQTTYQGTADVNDAKGATSGVGQVSGTHGFTKSFVEHGVIIGLANLRGDITYSQGLERYWSKSTRYDFYYPVLAQIGEQSILNKEIYYQDLPADNNVFGYQERYAEYRYKPSRLSGLMNVDHASGLSFFHLSEDFASLPTLGSSFIEANTGAPLDRAVAVPSQPHLIADFYFDMKCARPMPLFGVPGNLDHF